MNGPFLHSMDRMDAATAGPVLLLTPADEAAARENLSPLDLTLIALRDLSGLCVRLEHEGITSPAALILAEEMLDTGADRLYQALAGQPSWSDLPILLIVNKDDAARADSRWALLERLGNAAMLDRPLDPLALRNAVRIALRARQRQYDRQWHLDALRHATESLDARVDERTAAPRVSQARLRAIFETSGHFQTLLDPDGKVLETNAASLAAVGASLEDVSGLPYWDAPWFYETPGMSGLVRGMVQTAENGETVRQEIALDLPQGRRSFDLSMRPVLDEANATVALLAEAVETTHREDAQRRREAEESLHQVQKMEAIGQLTGGVAHDFNNLLTAVIGSLGLLQRRVVHDPGLTRLVEVASTAAQRGARLTQQLLAFARRQPLQPADLDLNDVIRTAAGALERTAGDGNALVFTHADTALPIRVDRAQLEAAVQNLVANARDASANGGRIVVETGRLPAERGTTAGRISLIVRDEGAGMTREVLDRVFEPFFTTKKAGVGTGMGLSMVYGFVRQSGGDITIDSTPNQGTTVRLLLPESAPAVHEEEDAPNELRPSHGERILIVEDEAAVQAVAAETLQQLGYPIRHAANGEAALRMLEARDIDLLFTDVIMPGSIDGITLARIARQKWPNLRILVTSGRIPDGADLRSGLGTKGAFLPKPYQPLDLALAVQNLLDAN